MLAVDLPAKFCYSTLNDREDTNFNAQWFIYYISLLYIVLSVHAIQKRIYMLKSFVRHSPGIGYPSSCFEPDKRHHSTAETQTYLQAKDETLSKIYRVNDMYIKGKISTILCTIYVQFYIQFVHNTQWSYTRIHFNIYFTVILETQAFWGFFFFFLYITSNPFQRPLTSIYKRILCVVMCVVGRVDVGVGVDNGV